MRVKINLAMAEDLDLLELTKILKENKNSVSFYSSKNVEDDFLYEIEEKGFILRGKTQKSLLESLNIKGAKTILKG